MNEFYSNGKLLLTSEYVVLDGIECIALPTKFGQSLEVNKNQLNVINWESYDYRNHLWFREKYIINKNKTLLYIEEKNDISSKEDNLTSSNNKEIKTNIEENTINK